MFTCESRSCLKDLPPYFAERVDIRRIWSLSFFLLVFSLLIIFPKTPVALGSEQTVYQSPDAVSVGEVVDYLKQTKITTTTNLANETSIKSILETQSKVVNQFSILATPVTPSAADQAELEALIQSSLQARKTSFTINYLPSNLSSDLLKSSILNVLSNPANIDINLSISKYSYSFYPNSVTFRFTYTAPITNAVTASTKDEVVTQLIDAVTNTKPTLKVKYTGPEALTNSDIMQSVNDYLDTPGNDYIKVRLSGSSISSITGFSKAIDADAQNGILFTASFTYVETALQTAYVDDQVTRIISQIIKDGMTEEEKEKAVHDYIVLVTAYDTTLKDHSAYGALSKGKTVCQGYALLGFKMLKSAGLDARIVLGNATSGTKSVGHAWVLVNVDGKWYHLDPTWDDPVPDQKGKVGYNYYNLTTQQITAKDHSITTSNLPASETAYTTTDPDILKKYRNVTLSSISLTPNVITLDIGGSTTLVPDIKPTDEVDKRVTWISSNPSVATVGPDGKITGKTIGSTTITATTVEVGGDGKSISASCQVVVKPVLVESVSLSQQSAGLKTGETLPLTATLTAKASIQGLTWKSSNPTIASVDTKGTVKALKVGTATITVTTTDGKLTDSCTVTVGMMPVATVALNAESAALEIGATKLLTATISPLTATNKIVTWTSSNPSVVTVSNTGLVKAIGLGEAAVTVSTADGSIKATCNITVGAKATGISLNRLTATVNPGDSVDLTVNLPSGVTVVGWSSSNLKNATVASSDVNKATVSIPLSAPGGNVNITVLASKGTAKFSALCTITVQIRLRQFR